MDPRNSQTVCSQRTHSAALAQQHLSGQSPTARCVLHGSWLHTHTTKEQKPAGALTHASAATTATCDPRGPDCPPQVPLAYADTKTHVLVHRWTQGLHTLIDLVQMHLPLEHEKARHQMSARTQCIQGAQGPMCEAHSATHSTHLPGLCDRGGHCPPLGCLGFV